MADTDTWDNEGGYQPLTLCRRCGRLRFEFHDGYCVKCWIKLNPPPVTPSKDKDRK